MAAGIRQYLGSIQMEDGKHIQVEVPPEELIHDFVMGGMCCVLMLQSIWL